MPITGKNELGVRSRAHARATLIQIAKVAVLRKLILTHPKRSTRIGHPSIFRNKKQGRRYQGIVTKVGSQKFEAARSRLGELAQRPVKWVSDADVFEFLARGEADTIEYIKSFAE